MRQLYPPIKPYHTNHLPVSKLHSLYFEQSGNPNGLPVIHFHGGPGSATKPDYRRFFNPQKYRIIMFDQRGCGKSTPLGEIKQNTTLDSIKDAEKIRRHLNIDEWLIFGGSYGSTLSLLYAQAYPQHCLGLILRGIYLGRPQDIKWVSQLGANYFYPDLWAQVEHYLLKHQVKTSDGFSFLYQQITKGTLPQQRQASAVLANWEWNISKLEQEFHHVTPNQITPKDIAGNRIFLYYALNQYFLKPNQVLKNCSKIKHLPTTIIHGRYDVVCPLIQAWKLHQALPVSKLEIVPVTGHHSSEPGIIDSLIRATNSFSP